MQANFVPSHDWQVVPPGTALPKGLWVKADLETGEMMARLIPQDQSNNDDDGHMRSGNDLKAIESSVSIPTAVATPAFSNIAEVHKTSSSTATPSEMCSPRNSATSHTEERSSSANDEKEGFMPSSIAGILKWSTQFHDTRSKPSNFAPMTEERREWLMKAMDSMTVQPVNQMENLIKLFEEIVADGITTPAQINSATDILESICSLVEDLDNARDLHLVGGFAPVVAQLASPHPQIRAMVSEVIATVVQNNPETQKFASDLGCMPVLMHIIAEDPDDESQAKAVRALSSLFRGNAHESTAFLQAGGVKMFSKCLKRSSEKTATKIVFSISRLLISFEPLRRESKLPHFAAEVVSCMSNFLPFSQYSEQAAIFLSSYARIVDPDLAILRGNAEIESTLKAIMTTMSESANENEDIAHSLALLREAHPTSTF